MMQKVDFFVVGAPKSGTSWLAVMLQQHPALFIPEQKEIHYFNREGLGKAWIKNPNYFCGLDWYHSHYKLARDGQLLGDMSPSYLSSETASADIKKYNPDAKIVIVMRNPVDRSFSDYLYRKQKGWLPQDCTFLQACEVFPDILRHSEYGKDIARYKDQFAAKNILLVFDEDITSRPVEVIEWVCTFFGIELVRPENLHQRVNVTGNPAHPRLVRLLTECKSLLFRLGMKSLLDYAKQTPIIAKLRDKVERVEPFDKSDKPSISLEDRNRLVGYFLQDIGKIESLSGRSLDGWKS